VKIIETKDPLSYKDRLKTHLDSYIRAVIDNPDVRLNEFHQLKSYAALRNPTRVLEVPVEGKVLEMCYPGVRIDRADFLQPKANHYANPVMLTDWALTGVEPSLFDAVLAVAPFHHANSTQKRLYVRGAWRALRPGGVLAVGEVEADSAVHRFLDGFINNHTLTGHKGNYPDRHFNQVLIQEGFAGVESEVRACPWRFPTAEALFLYMNRLFALKPISQCHLLAALEETLGLYEKNGSLYLNWSLRYFRGVKPIASKIACI
jgi:SAM-dependent methyltransferase